MAQKKLEQYTWFPFIAWTLCVGFALFVGSLALELHQVGTDGLDPDSAVHQRTRALQEELNRGQQPATSTIENAESR